MRANLVTVALLLVAGCAGALGHKLPSYFGKPCSRSLPDADLSACAQRAANAGIPSLTNGDKKLRIASMNPLLVPRVALSQGGSSQISLNLTWEPLEIHGLPEARLSNMKLSWKRKTTEFDILLPVFTMAGNYKAAGRILLLPITGSGPSNFTFENLKIHYSFDWPLQKAADGKEYATVVNSKIAIVSADALRSQLKGLFNGDKVLGAQMNSFLNENWRDVLRELGPSLVEAAKEVVELAIKTLIASVPIPDMFLP
ncbi:protein takeout-like [Frankliniella occidentalis]|uniref:Protein takeout-like n=1 Tax=Frankliniella occidentalis TaxID=133901 RepID=A0A6J1SEG5_FRAOC|nr:protein takeout-like [Frankliniella occidentalis]